MRWVANLRVLVVLVGWLAAFWGVAYAVNGMTQAPATVRVPVSLMPAPERSGWGNIQVDVPGIALEASGDEPSPRFAGARPGGWETTVGGLAGGPDGTLTLAAWGSTRVEQLLSRGTMLVSGLGMLVGALALAPVLDSISLGRPFARGNARRLVVLGVTIAVTGLVAPMLPALAGELVLQRTGLAGPRLGAAPGGSLAPIVVGLVVLALAAAFRAGERMSDDVRGLV